jgi:hypothetical protein
MKANWNSLLQNDKPNFNVIAAKMSTTTKSIILSNSKIFLRLRGLINSKNNSIQTKHKLELFRTETIYQLSFNPTAAKMAIESMEILTKKFFNSSKFQPHEDPG